MLRGLYTAYTGMLNQQQRLEVTTNNLANAATVGYKKEGSTSQAFDECLTIKINDASENYVRRGIGNMSLGVKIGETYTNYGQGSVRETGEPFDLAIGGNGFFNISYTNKKGQEFTMYTRDGSFTLTKEGNLVTKDGDFVLGQNGPIVLPTDAEITIDAMGNIYNGNELLDQLKITDFEDYNYLDKFGENMYRTVDGATEKEAVGQINQGYLEMSNVQVVEEMVSMITIQRAYEAAQKVETSMDEILGQVVTLGKL
ncbi:MAG: flagellar basal-body rod protein FlgF [Thermoflexaceae bacterium]|nr:flagellar basal-body rod protein FlgF [Thermoflexaceae bacterium]